MGNIILTLDNRLLEGLDEIQEQIREQKKKKISAEDYEQTESDDN